MLIEEAAFSESPSPHKPADDTIVSVDRAFLIVEMLADAPDGASLADIARSLDVNKAIAVKLLNTLERLEIVWRDDRVQRFFLTYRISNLGLRHLQASRLLDQCAAVLKTLAEESGELVRLAVVEPGGERLTWVHLVAGMRRSLQIDPNYSLEISFNSHAIAKAWLSTMPVEQAERLVLKQGLHPYTINTLTSIAAVKADLGHAARQGFACSFEENELGVNAVAAPILAANFIGGMECVGAVSLAAPTHRLSRADLKGWGPRVRETANHLARIWPLEARARNGPFSRPF